MKRLQRRAQDSSDVVLPQVRYALKSLIMDFLGGDVYPLLFPAIGLQYYQATDMSSVTYSMNLSLCTFHLSGEHMTRLKEGKAAPTAAVSVYLHA